MRAWQLLLRGQAQEAPEQASCAGLSIRSVSCSGTCGPGPKPCTDQKIRPPSSSHGKALPEHRTLEQVGCARLARAVRRASSRALTRGHTHAEQEPEPQTTNPWPSMQWPNAKGPWPQQLHAEQAVQAAVTAAVAEAVEKAVDPSTHIYKATCYNYIPW